MNLNLNPLWQEALKDQIQAEYFTTLIHKVNQAYQNTTCYPDKEAIFAAFNWCKYTDLKVVILGQDPYHGPGQANGLAFSVHDGMRFPPSLMNIFKELEQDLNLPIPIGGSLERWAIQGVLLLNSILTVEKSKPGSHQNWGWEIFTDAVIRHLSESKENIVFILWGGFAKSKIALIDTQKHLVLTSGHPSPMSANRGYFFGNKHFSKTNDYLLSVNKKPIEW